jgi:hypothetical protein
LDKQGVSIIAENGTALYSIKPIIENINSKGVVIYLYTSVEKKFASTEVSIPITHIISINTITTRYKSVFDFLLKQLLVNSKFSSQYSRINKTNSELLNFVGNVLLKLPKPNTKKVNKIYSSIWKLINRKPIFKTEKLLVVTRSGNSYLLNNKHHTIYTLVESWDHPVKSPFFFQSKTTYVWNQSLIEDVAEFQNYGVSSIKTIFPLKFRYIEELQNRTLNVSNTSIQNELNFIKKSSYILYICTYSNFSGNNLFEGEKILIKQIIDICKEGGKILYIKPHPHSNGKEFNFLKDDDTFRVGISANNSGYNYIFTDEDQYYKIQLLTNARMIINVGTTLVLESSLLNTNIVQIKLNDKYKNFKVASENYHNKKYLNNNPYILDLNKESLSEIEQYMQKENKFSKYLQKWVTSKDYKNSIEELVNDII